MLLDRNEPDFSAFSFYCLVDSVMRVDRYAATHFMNKVSLDLVSRS